MTEVFVKTHSGAQPGQLAYEAAGLRWLAEAQPSGAVPVVVPLTEADHHVTRLELPRLTPATPTVAAARQFGRRLARTHAAGAEWFGCPPQGWEHDGFIGNAPLPLLPQPGPARWGGFYAEYRVAPYVRAARDQGSFTTEQAQLFDRLCQRLTDDTLTGPDRPPARIHGDLWSGNVFWSGTDSGETEVVLIDPAAHGGNPETDLAMLALFGLPHLDQVVAAYHEAEPLADGWRERVALHQLHPLLVHTVLFGGGYATQAVAAAKRYG